MLQSFGTWIISRTSHNMCIMRSLFTCQRDIGINTPNNLTWPTCFAQKQKTERKTCSKSTFYRFPNSMNKSQSLFSLLKVWPGVPGELLGKWIDMKDRQQQKLRSLRKWKDVLKVESGVPGELLVKWIKTSLLTTWSRKSFCWQTLSRQTTKKGVDIQ